MTEQIKEIKDFREFKTAEEKCMFLKNLQLKPLESFIKEQFGLSVKFKKTIYVKKGTEQVQMNLETDDIKQYTGAMKNLFKKVTLSTFGSISFHTVVKPSIDCDAKFSELSFPDITFSYKFVDGGHNGHTCIYVKYDLDQRNWYLKSCKDNYSMTHAYPGNYQPWEEAYEQDRLVEIKEV